MPRNFFAICKRYFNLQFQISIWLRRKISCLFIAYTKALLCFIFRTTKYLTKPTSESQVCVLFSFYSTGFGFIFYPSNNEVFFEIINCNDVKMKGMIHITALQQLILPIFILISFSSLSLIMLTRHPSKISLSEPSLLLFDSGKISQVFESQEHRLESISWRKSMYVLLSSNFKDQARP